MTGKSFHPPPHEGWFEHKSNHSLSRHRLVPGLQDTRMPLCLRLGRLAWIFIIECNGKRHLKPEPPPKKELGKIKKNRVWDICSPSELLLPRALFPEVRDCVPIKNRCTSKDRGWRRHNGRQGKAQEWWNENPRGARAAHQEKLPHTATRESPWAPMKNPCPATKTQLSPPI